MCALDLYLRMPRLGSPPPLLFFDVFAAVARLSNHSCILRRVTERTQKEGAKAWPASSRVYVSM